MRKGLCHGLMQVQQKGCQKAISMFPESSILCGLEAQGEAVLLCHGRTRFLLCRCLAGLCVRSGRAQDA